MFWLDKVRRKLIKCPKCKAFYYYYDEYPYVLEREKLFKSKNDDQIAEILRSELRSSFTISEKKVSLSNKHITTQHKANILTDREIKYLIEKAESCIDSNDLHQALQCYSQLIEKTLPHPHYFKKRAWVYRMIGEFDNAINDMNKAIDLDPDDGNSYWERGACYAHKLSLEKNIEGNSKKQMLRKILTDYKSSVERNPTSSEAWLAVLETDMLLHNWDDAISNYGACKPYIDTKEYQLVRAWLGCLSLIFADYSLEEEDKELLHDKSIRLKKIHWCVSEIDSLLIELEREGFNKEKIYKAKEFHQKFLDHFDEQPIRFQL